MQCQENNKILDAYLDDEVALMQSVTLEEHLAGCAECTHKLANRRELQDAMQNAKLRYTAPSELMKGVRKALRATEENSGSPQWILIKYAALGFGVATVLFVLVGAILGFWFHVPEEQKIASTATDDYVRSMMAENHGVDVTSSDKNVLKSWFNGKTSFSPEIQSFDDKGFPLAGERLDFLADRTAAALVYRRNQHFIDVFLYADSENAHEGKRQERGYNVVYWAKNGMQYWAVSDLNLQELQQLAQLLKD